MSDNMVLIYNALVYLGAKILHPTYTRFSISAHKKCLETYGESVCQSYQ